MKNIKREDTEKYEAHVEKEHQRNNRGDKLKKKDSKESMSRSRKSQEDLRESNSIQRKIETQTSDSIWPNDHQGTSRLIQKVILRELSVFM